MVHYRLKLIRDAVAKRDPETLDVAEALRLLAIVLVILEDTDNNAEELGRRVLRLHAEVTEGEP
jgi:hypothetical protein